MEKSAAIFRLLFFFGFVTLIYVVQRFWFMNAWHRIEKIERVVVRRTLEGLWAVALVLLVASVLDPMLGRVFPRGGIGTALIDICRLWLFASFFGFLAYQLVALFGWTSGLAAKLLPLKSAEFEPARRHFFRYATYLAGSLPFAAAAYGFASGRFNYQIRKVDVPVSGLPQSLQGLKIVQLSDIHAGDYMPEDQVRRAVDMANDLGAHLAVVTGDFISNHNDPLEACIAELSRLRAPLGTWGCNGNHEIYAGAEATAQQLFQKHGMRLLRQENVTLEHAGQQFNLIGVDYQRDRMTRGPRGPMLQNIESLVSRSLPNILLSHNPNSFHRAAELGIELSLAGHTHGGQVKVEIVDHDVTPARLITEFVAGLYKLPMTNGSHGEATEGNSIKSACLYVNRGLGTFGMPVRIGVPPEITLLTLQPA